MKRPPLFCWAKNAPNNKDFMNISMRKAKWEKPEANKVAEVNIEASGE